MGRRSLYWNGHQAFPTLVWGTCRMSKRLCTWVASVDWQVYVLHVITLTPVRSHRSPRLDEWPSNMMTSSNGNIFPRNWPFVRGIHRSPVNSPHKASDAELWCFFFICVWIDDWVNNREADDLRRYRGHYDVTVMNGLEVASSSNLMICTEYLIYTILRVNLTTFKIQNRIT